MGALKEAMLDIEDDLLSIARDGAGDLYYTIQDGIDDIKEQMREFIDDEYAEMFYQYIGGDEDDFNAWLDNVVNDALSEEGISV